MDKAKEPEELTPEVDENLTKDVIKSAKKYEIEDEKKKEKRSKKKSKSKKREEKSAKKKRNPLEKDVKAEIEIKELKEDIIKTAMDAKELTPVAHDKMGDKVVKPKKVFEIEVDKKKKEKSKKYSKSKKSEKKEAEATPKKHKIPILVKEEVLPDVEELNLNDMETAKELSPAVEKNVHKKAAKVGKAKAKIKHHKEKKKQSKKSKNSKKGSKQRTSKKNSVPSKKDKKAIHEIKELKEDIMATAVEGKELLPSVENKNYKEIDHVKKDSKIKDRLIAKNLEVEKIKGKDEDG
ncbi:hypothetical protein D917_10505, partial [Trichinella nativa]